MGRYTSTRQKARRRHLRNWSMISIVFSILGMTSFFMTGVSSDFHWGWWTTLAFGLGTIVCLTGSLCSAIIATEGQP